MKKTDAAVLLIRRALEYGTKADYVLMDTWFTTELMIKEVLKTGLDVIGMVKQLKQRYVYRGKLCTLPELRKFIQFGNAKNTFGSLLVTTRDGIPAKIVFIRNRNKKSECLYLLSTDCSLNESEIIRIYGNIRSIECFFKATKSFMKLGAEFQSCSFDAIVSHTTIVFTRYIMLQDMDLTNALQSLMTLFVEQLCNIPTEITNIIKCKVTEWMKSQAMFIQALFGEFSWES